MRGRLEHNTDTMQVLQLHFGAQVRYQKEKKKLLVKVRTRRWSGEEIATKKVSAHGIEKQ